jgi:type IV pilus assembly protein PilB
VKIKNREPEKTLSVITSNKVVARFLDGRMVKGWCQAFRQDRPLVKIESVDRSDTREVAWEDLKALFFVREFEGLNRSLDEAVLPQASPVSNLGQHVQLEFLDGEVIQGYAEGLKKEGRGFFIVPLDPESNNLRIFVPQSALRKLSVAPKLGETMVREGMVHQKDVGTALQKQEKYRETRLGEVIVEVGMTSPEEVERALNVQRMVGLKVGRILVQADILSEEDLQKCLTLQQENRNKRLGQNPVEMGFATPEAVSLALALKYRLPYVDLSVYPVDYDAAALVKEEIARRLKFISIGKKEGQITIAIDDPMNFGPRDYLQSVLGLRVKEVLATAEGIQNALSRFYGASAPGEQTYHPAALRTAGKEVLEEKPSGSAHGANETSVAELLDAILRTAAEKNATDIHLNPERETTTVSYRIDGVLHPEKVLDTHLHPLVVSRIKIMGNMNVSERNLPQEGRTRLRVGKKLFDMRISSLPAIWGESIVIRLGEKSAPVMKLEELGFIPEDLGPIRSLLNRTQGVILVTGPTGSGKSTTLYSFLQEPVFERRNIITIDDRIEHEFSSATQIQIKPHIDLTYAKTLRQSLKHNPDVIVLGEIRDPETARMAVHAGLTGHLILGTIHAPSASESLSLLLDMGIEPYLIASSLIAVISQRLVKKICSGAGCRKKDQRAIELLTAAGIPIEPVKGLTFWKGTGCDECRNGYKGRTPIYEMMLIDGPMKRAIVERKSAKDLQRLARSMEMRTLSEAAFLKAGSGVTTVEQIISLSFSDMD